MALIDCLGNEVKPGLYGHKRADFLHLYDIHLVEKTGALAAQVFYFDRYWAEHFPNIVIVVEKEGELPKGYCQGIPSIVAGDLRPTTARAYLERIGRLKGLAENFIQNHCQVRQEEDSNSNPDS